MSVRRTTTTKGLAAPKPKRKHTRKADQQEPRPVTAQPVGKPINGMGGWQGGYRRGREK